MSPNLPITSSTTLSVMTGLNLLPQRIAASVAGTLGLVGLLLAAIGIYGVTSYAVARRTREIGIRMALGADSGRVLGLVLRQGAALTAIGSLIGLAIAAAAARALESLLFGVPGLDPLTFTGTAALFALVALAATAMPARRAASIDPMRALRQD
jgi:ABC-type antimicrobial peptide transport system permease subunit